MLFSVIFKHHWKPEVQVIYRVTLGQTIIGLNAGWLMLPTLKVGVSIETMPAFILPVQYDMMQQYSCYWHCLDKLVVIRNAFIVFVITRR